MTTSEVSIRVFNRKLEAYTAAEQMRQNGFVVSEAMEVTDLVSWNNLAVTPAISDDAQAVDGPSIWVVVGRR